MNTTKSNKLKIRIGIIGSGAVGNAIARELCQYEADIFILEKEPDTAFGTSGRNSAVVHAGFNNKPGSLMAKLCVQGSQGFEKEAKELGIGFLRTGKLVVALDEEGLPGLQKLYDQGMANGTELLEIIREEQIQAIDPNIRGIAALSSGMTGVFDPFEYTIALAETAVANGARFLFGRKVTGIEVRECAANRATGTATPASNSTATPASTGTSTPREDAPFLVRAYNEVTGETERYEADILVNAAGLGADEICRLAGIDDYTIFPCRGEYHILNQEIGEKLKLPVYPVPSPTSGGLGVHLTPTIHGNLMIGPSAEYLDERDDYATTAEVMDQLYHEGKDLFPMVERDQFIRSFAGIRPKLTSKEKGGYSDFVIKESDSVENMILLVGIESPGLTSSIPIAKMVREMIEQKHALVEKPQTQIRTRQDWKAELAKHEPIDNKEELLHPWKPLGDERLICRCEFKSSTDILRAYDDIEAIGAIPTVKGLKHRTRIGMGNCQGSFCTVDLVTLLAEKRGFDPLDLTYESFGSGMFSGFTRNPDGRNV